MNKKNIIDGAIAMLKANTEILGKWEATPVSEIDGKITLVVDKEFLQFNAIVKDTIRPFQIPTILDKSNRYNPIIVIGRNIFPKIKNILRQAEIAYLEENGNIFLKRNGVTLWLDGQKSIPVKNEKDNRAFTKTGLKVIFHFLTDQHLLNLTYREIANTTKVALGNINYIVTGLKQLHFITNLDSKTLILSNKQELLQKWLTAYEERLKPTLFIGNFRFIKKEDLSNWKNIKLDAEKTQWGGEPAGDILTHYLHPEELTIYTTETRIELMKNYKLIPDNNGYIKIYQKFWEYTTDTSTVPPLLVYTDLMNTADRRCMETAQKIYNEYLQNQFKSN